MSDKMKVATRADVAKRANVSETIVSYVMNNNRCVDAEKRRRVLKAAKELNYRPNAIARALSGKNSSQILFVVDTPDNERLIHLLSELEQYAYNKGSLVSLCTTRNDLEFVRQIVGRMFDGVIISSARLYEEYIQELIDAGIPTVLLLSHEYNLTTGVSKIDTGLKTAARDAVHYLYDSGRRNIIYLDRTDPNGVSSDLSDGRLCGFARGMEELGYEWKSRVIAGCVSEESMKSRIKEFIMSDKVDAIIARYDKLAVSALKTITSMGLKIPEEIALMGFDNTSACEIVTPCLTSVRFDDAGIAKEAVDMIYQMRAGIERTDTVYFPCEIVKRESTKNGC